MIRPVQQLFFGFLLVTLVKFSFAAATTQQDANFKCKAFPDAIGELERQNYLRATSENSSGQVLGSRALRGFAALITRKPFILKGIETKSFRWTNEWPSVTGAGSGVYGSIEVTLPSEKADHCSIRIQNMNGSIPLTVRKIERLSALFPNLVVSPADGKVDDIHQLNNINLGLHRRNRESLEDFGQLVRSLVNTIVNDPLDFLGGNPEPSHTLFKIPDELISIPLIHANAAFFGTLADWTRTKKSVWQTRKVNKMNGVSPPHSPNLTVFQIYSDSRLISLWLENGSFRDDLVANIRRAVRAALDARLDQVPNMVIEGINGLTIRPLPITSDAVRFAELVHKSMNQPGFDRPLANLNLQERESVAEWLRYRHLDQSDLTVPSITLREVIEIPASDQTE